MKQEKSKGKRGRPRKHPIKERIESDTKRGRGRPPKIKGIENIIVIGEKGKGKTIGMVEKIATIIEDDYKEPKILRKIRVFIFDRSIFHSFSKKFNGDIITMSYIVNELMDRYLNKKIKLDIKDKSFMYYNEWCKVSPVTLEPITMNDMAQAGAVLRGIPLQYKYNLIIDEDTYNKLQINHEYYPQFTINLLVKMYLNDENKINIDIAKAHGWCNFG